MRKRADPFHQGTLRARPNFNEEREARSKKKVAAEAYPDALAHLTAVMTAKDDPLIARN